MRCIVCMELIGPDDEAFVVGDEAVHHECCNLIEMGLIVNKIEYVNREIDSTIQAL